MIFLFAVARFSGRVINMICVIYKNCHGSGGGVKFFFMKFCGKGEYGLKVKNDDQFFNPVIFTIEVLGVSY